MDTLCDVCHRSTGDDRHLCEACEYRARTRLQGLPEMAGLLQLCLQPTSGQAQRGGSGRAHSPLPVDLRVLDLLGPGHPVPLADPHGDQTGGVPISALLAGWAHYIAADVPIVYTGTDGTVRTGAHAYATAVPRTGTGITAWSAWLIRYLPYAVTRPYVEPFYTQLEDVVHRIQRITHTRPRRTAKDAPCPACSAFALVELEDQLHISCDACGHRLTPEEYSVHRDQVMPALARTALLIQAARQKSAAA